MAEFLVRSASAPFFQILSQWINRGIIVDHGKDFYVEDNEVKSQYYVVVYGTMMSPSKYPVGCVSTLPVLIAFTPATQPYSQNARAAAKLNRKCSSLNAQGILWH